MQTPPLLTITLAVMLASFLLGLWGFVGLPHLIGPRWGRGALFIAVALLPVSVSLAGLKAGIAESGRTRFCLGCHEMQNHGKSLFADDRSALAAVHYQNRLIDRDQACYTCHSDYALFGDIKTKLSGLRHVWVHYLGKVPDRFALYQPFSNQNCLHCHDDGRRFAEGPTHKGILPRLGSGEISCLQCHKVAHDLAKVNEGVLWKAP